MRRTKTEIQKHFGWRIRALRKAKGFSQESFAVECGLDRTYIGGIERGERNPALRNIEAIADALDISLSELMRGL
ncbi:MAG: helix-turn-helix domain-containing protein [Planctomycetaceae bacterium]